MNAAAKSSGVVMTAQAKTRQGKGAARELRRQGFVPGVIYAAGEDSQSIAVNAKELAAALRAGHFYTHTQQLNLDGKATKVLARDIQRDPVSGVPLHIDFIRFNPASQVNVNVVVKVVGDELSPGIKAGGVIQMIESELEVVCRADAIPEEITVDISALDIGESVHLSEVTLPKGVKAAETVRDLTIVSVVSTRLSKADEAAEAAEAAAAAPAEVPATAQKGEGDAKDAK
jgi:large subunit ribosomal protein L25